MPAGCAVLSLLLFLLGNTLMCGAFGIILVVCPSVNNGDYFALISKDAQVVPNSSPYFALEWENATFALNKEVAGSAGGQP